MVNGASDTVSVIDSKTNTVGPHIVVGDSPHVMALDTVNQRLYVATFLDGVSVIDIKTNTVVKKYQLKELMRRLHSIQHIREYTSPIVMRTR
ncbi:MAG TPA: hypothetical protein VJ772_06085 [Nitrososphaeraceae archaeon]|nr:hypothetical protein [Nitrososphaeraceae archaeon]